jgi:hypothetical protein
VSRVSDGLFDALFDLMNATLSVQAVSDDIVSQYKFIQLLLQVSILQGKQISVVLQGVELLLKAVVDLS